VKITPRAQPNEEPGLVIGHRVKGACSMCKKEDVTDFQIVGPTPIICLDCKRNFYGEFEKSLLKELEKRMGLKK
jgi:hypothetical protein